MRKFSIVVAGALGALAVPTAAMADAPVPGTWTINEANAAGQDALVYSDVADGNFTGSAMGEYNARVKQNGWYISAQAHDLGGRHVAFGQSK
jgi:hypothetical protein